MTIEFEGNSRGTNFSVDCETCFNPFGEEPTGIAGINEGLNRTAANNAVLLHEFEFGKDHALIVRGWKIYSKKNQPQPLNDLDEKGLKKLLSDQMEAVVTRTERYSRINSQDYDVNISRNGLENSLTMSFILTAEEIAKAPQEVAALFSQMGIVAEDDVEVFVVGDGLDMKLGIEPTRVDQNKSGVLFPSRLLSSPSLIVCHPDGEGIKYFKQDEARNRNTPVQVANLLEAYNHEENCGSSFSEFSAGNTFVVGLNWALNMIDRRKIEPTGRMVYDHNRKVFIPVSY